MSNLSRKHNGSYAPSPGQKAEDKQRLAEILQETAERERGRSKIASLFPDHGKLRRELYPKHLEHFRAGGQHRERLFLAGNRVGKTVAGAYEVTLHLTGLYPDWWEGKRFDRPVRAVASSDTAKNTRDIIQHQLFGLPREKGTGMIPGRRILSTTPKHGLAEAYDTAYIRHISGGVSRLILKSFDQGVEAFYGTGEDVAWLDEEPPLEIKTECCMRTMTTGGIVIMTLTPLYGRTPLIEEFLQSAVNRDALPIQ